jgi:hypothetical protein
MEENGMPEKPSDRTKYLQLEVPFETKPEKEINVIAYAFDRGGKLIGQAPLKDGVAKVAVPEGQERRVRLFLAPAPTGGKKQEPTLEMMERSRAYEPVLKIGPKGDVGKIEAIPDALSRYWLLCRCRVRGQVVRPVGVGGSSHDFPVCHARVHICEVDPLRWIILHLPDDLIFRVRDELLQEIIKPFPPNPPDPPPFVFDPGVIDPSPIAVAELNKSSRSKAVEEQLGKLPVRRSTAAGRFVSPGDIAGFDPQPDPPRPGDLVALNPQPEPPGSQLVREQISMRPGDLASLNPQPLPPRESMALAQLSQKTKTLLSASSATALRQGLVANLDLIRPYLCYWRWLWWRYRCDEVAVVQTDDQGHFDATIWYPCFGDHPDLYFWVEYSIGGVWTTVYRPPVPCNIHWNYPCGSEVIIRITDPRVPPCGDIPDLPGLQVAILSIGNGVSTSEIQAAAAGASEGLTTSGEPFGGVLEPHVFFSRTALFALNITHYRWSYRRRTLSDGTTATSDIWHALDHQVIRHYAVEDPVTLALSFPAAQMGPDPAFPGQNLCKIQPINPPAGAIDWAPMVDAREDSATAFFLTHLLAGGNAEAGAGKYELKFELFKNDGSLVNLTDAGIKLKVADVPAPFGPGTVTTIAPTEEHLIRDAASKVVAFRMVVRVDNNACEAEINPFSGTGLVTDVDCGFIEYSPGATINLSFKARHAHNFASFSFTVYRGAGNYVAEAGASGVVGSSPINGFVRDPASVFTKTGIPVATMLASGVPPGQPPCTKAAFAENLYVAASATDGWSRLSYLDASGVPNAFALEPSP